MTPEEEERGWEELRARWAEEEAHRAWLAGFGDLEGLARAGGRYRAVLAEHPGDAVAARWRDEVVKRATVHGLACLPRTAPPRAIPGWAKRAAVAVLSTSLAYALYWFVRQLLELTRDR